MGLEFGTSRARACDRTFYNGQERDQTPRRTGPRAPLSNPKLVTVDALVPVPTRDNSLAKKGSRCRLCRTLHPVP